MLLLTPPPLLLAAGFYQPYLNFTRIDTRIELAEKGWNVNDELKLTSGLLHVAGNHQNGNWIFDPIHYSAGGQYRLSGADEGEDSYYLAASAMGMVDQENDQNVVKVSSSLGPIDNAYKRLLPGPEYYVPAAGNISVLTGDFFVCVSNTDIDFGSMDCIDGVVIESTVVVDSFLSSFLSPFGYSGANATVGMKVTAILPRDESSENVILVEAIFAGRGLALSPSVTLTNVFMRTTDWNDVHYQFLVKVNLVNDADLYLKGEGSFEGEDKRSEVTLSTTLSDDVALHPSFHLLQSCAIQLKMEYSNSTNWKAAKLDWTDCGGGSKRTGAKRR